MGALASRPAAAAVPATFSSATAAPAARGPAGEELATFAAGCFWSVELAFQRQPGVLRTEVGYTGGTSTAHDYESVCSGRTGHAEAVQLVYNPAEVSYSELLDVFWHKHDPTQVDRQGNDVGTQYRSAIFTHSADQLATAIASRDALSAAMGRKIATEIRPIDALGTVGGWWRCVCAASLCAPVPTRAAASLVLTLPTFLPGHSPPHVRAETYHQAYLQKGGQCAAKGDKTPIRCYG